MKGARQGRAIASGVLLGATLLLSCQSQGDRAGRQPAQILTGEATSADGVPIYYMVTGSGDRAVVLVHGWSCDASYWSEQLESLRDDFVVVSLDLAGHGRSGSGRTDWSMANFGADVAAVITTLNLPEVVLVGHSMGGAVCIEAARLLPERVIGLVGVDTYQALAHRWSVEQAEAFIAPFREDFAGTTREFVSGMFAATTDSELIELVVSDLAAASPEAAIPSFEALFAYDAVAALADMRKPIRAINCDLYPTDTTGNRNVAAAFDVVIVPGTGHFLHLERPEEFDRLLRAVLDEF